MLITIVPDISTWEPLPLCIYIHNQYGVFSTSVEAVRTNRSRDGRRQRVCVESHKKVGESGFGSAAAFVAPLKEV